MLTIKQLIKYILSALLLVVNACSLSETIDTEVDRNLEKIQTSLENAHPPETQMSLDTISVKDDIWLGNTSMKIHEGEALPAKFETENGITLFNTQPVSLMTLAEQLTRMTGITVRMDERIEEEEEDLFEDEEEVEEGDPTPRYMILPNYEGKLSGFLDQVAARFGLWWRYKNNEIVFYKSDTRIFTFYALPTVSNLSASIGGTSSGGDGSSTSTTLDSSIEADFWTEIDETITAMIPETAKMTSSKTNGTVTVTASPYILQRVAQYVRTMNEKLSRQVAISVKVLQVTLNDEEQMGLNMNLVTSALSSRLGFNIATTTALTAATGTTDTLTMGLVQPVGCVAGQQCSWNPGDSSDIWDKLWTPSWKLEEITEGDATSYKWVPNFDGENNPGYSASNAVIDAISKQGATSLVTSATVTTLNNKVAPVQVSTETTYISSSETTITDGTTSITQETDTVNAGFTMEVLPRILDHGRLLLMFTMTITELTNLETVSSGTSMMQLPTVETRGFVQEVAMISGSTLILSGFEKVQASNQKTKGVTGMRKQSEKDRNILVVLLTPEVLISPLSPETRMQR